MRILIAEDEPVSARRLADMTRKILGNQIGNLHIEKNFDSASLYLQTNEIDLLLLDLSLADQNGFELLRNISKSKFSTIIVSGFTERAIEAFQYEVLDFVAKPFNEERLAIALHRFTAQTNKQLSITSEGKITFLNLNEIIYVAANGKSSKIYNINGSTYFYRKTLGELHTQLGENFLRVHKSYLIQSSKIHEIEIGRGSKYFVILPSGEKIPLSRTVYKELIATRAG
jgi:DNA-binding LytR/AlgR family response regulator